VVTLGGIDTFRILFVCTGNICRSPMAERLTAARLQEPAPWVSVSSAGTYAMVGSPIEPNALAMLAELEIAEAAFAARDLAADFVASADLVLGASREHRAAVVRLVPSASSRTFALREFARLAPLVDASALTAADPVERARQAVAAVAAKRGYARPDSPSDDDVPDPYRRSAAEFRVAATLISDAVDTLVALLAPNHR
jgi:protein-tyrosine phosphatase